MRLKDYFSTAQKDKTFVLSFEVFPPKEGSALPTLYEHFHEFEAMGPAFISVTYGAGGSTRRYTIDIASQILKNHKFGAMAHLTTVGSTKDEMTAILGQMKAAGITNIIALRGDPPAGQTNFQAVSGGFSYAGELVTFMRSHFPDDFDIAVAGYPEGHPEIGDKEKDWDHLADKVRAGADAIVTQLFFNNPDFYKFRDGLAKRGITAPISAGIMAISNVKQIKRISQLSGALMPPNLLEKLEKHPENAEEIGNEWAAKQIQDLIAQGIGGLHFYTMNRPKQTHSVLKLAGLLKT